MDIPEEMAVLGMVPVGRFVGVDGARSSTTETTKEINGGVVIAFVVGNEILMFIATDGGSEARVRGAGSALKRVLETGREPNDQFQAHAPTVILERGQIDVWARPSTAPQRERLALNRRYSPAWSSSGVSE